MLIFTCGCTRCRNPTSRRHREWGGGADLASGLFFTVKMSTDVAVCAAGEEF